MISSMYLATALSNLSIIASSLDLSLLPIKLYSREVLNCHYRYYKIIISIAFQLDLSAITNTTAATTVTYQSLHTCSLKSIYFMKCYPFELNSDCYYCCCYRSCYNFKTLALT